MFCAKIPRLSNVLCVLTVFFTSTLLFSADPKDTLLRIKIAESVFDEKFGQERIERLLKKSLDAELSLLEKDPASTEYVTRIRKLLTAVATDAANSKSFKEQYAAWLADQFDVAELRRYYDFVRSDFGKKIGDLDDRVQPLLFEAIHRVSRGRLDSIPVLLAEARSK